MQRAAENDIVKAVAAVAVIAAVDGLFKLIIIPYIIANYSTGEFSIIYKNIKYINYAFSGAIALALALTLTSILKSFVRRVNVMSNGQRNLNGVFIILRVLIYALAITWFLADIGVNLEGALIGGTIGGVIIGFAVQSVVSSLLSGMMITAGGFMKPDEAISVSSWMFSDTRTGTVEDVRTLYTKVRLPNSNVILIPNTILFGSAIFTRLNKGRNIIYNFSATVPSDTNAFEILEILNSKKEGIRNDLNLISLNIFLNSKNGTTNSFSIIIEFSDMNKINDIINALNLEVEKAYWGVKNKPKTQ